MRKLSREDKKRLLSGVDDAFGWYNIEVCENVSTYIKSSLK